MTFDKWKRMTFPRHVLVGHKVLDQIGELASDLQLGSRVLIVADETTKRIAGDAAGRALEGVKHKVEFQLIQGATMKSVETVKAAVAKTKSDYLVAVGGGSVIDVTKLAAFDLGLHYISTPTSAAHDGIASGNASIKEMVGNVSKQAKPPEAIVADTHLILKAPYRMLASGCGDILSNLTAVKDWELSAALKGEEYSSFAAALSKNSAEIVLEAADSIKPGLEEAVWLVVKSLIASGVAMGVAGNSRPASGSEHMFSHMLDRLAPGKAMHGEQCGVGTIMVMKLHRGDWKRVRDALKTIGAPTNAKELGIPGETIIQALVGAHTIRPDRYTILGESGLTIDAATQLAQDTGVV